MTRRFVLFALAICVACKPSPPPAKPAGAGPQVRATVVTIRTTVRPENKVWVRNLVIAGDRARDTGELDTWRLYDTKAETVTFVDDVARTSRTEALARLVAQREELLQKPLPAHYSRATFKRTKERRALQGVTAEQALIEAGTYRRELWLAEHPSIPRGLFGMMQASEPSSTPLVPMMRTVDEALMSARGFPLADRATIPLGDQTIIIERDVLRIVLQPVSASLLAVPAGYRDLTPKPKPAK